MKKIAILGSTGSIGTQSLDVIRQHPERFQVEALTCGRNVSLLEKQIEEFHPQMVVTELEEDARKISAKYPHLDVMFGRDGLIAAATGECDMVLNSLMGMRGLEPTYHAICLGKEIALANKETLVSGGELIMKKAEECHVQILPIDSEHSAIFQCLEGNQNRKIKKILLTASGGPFRGYTKEQIKHVTREQALKHPNWNMGAKITIDSSTMMNKGLEVIEARWLFDVPASRIQVLVHPQSILHSAVEFEDNSVIGQMGVQDMRIPISLALGYPDRLKNPDKELDFFTQGSNLTFEKPDLDVFPCLKYAIEAIEAGGSYPAAMNGANEVLVDAFLKGKIRYTDIPEKLARILDWHKPAYKLDLETILNIDQEVRDYTERLCEVL